MLIWMKDESSRSVINRASFVAIVIGIVLLHQNVSTGRHQTPELITTLIICPIQILLIVNIKSLLNSLSTNYSKVSYAISFPLLTTIIIYVYSSFVGLEEIIMPYTIHNLTTVPICLILNFLLIGYLQAKNKNVSTDKRGR